MINLCFYQCSFLLDANSYAFAYACAYALMSLGKKDFGNHEGNAKENVIEKNCALLKEGF